MTKKRLILATFAVLAAALVGAIAYTAVASADSDLFSKADKNSDGVLDKTEFMDYVKISQAKKQKMANSVKKSVRICPRTGEICDNDCSGDSGGCCKEEKAEGKSGCCENKENAEGKSGCCKNKENAEGKSGCCKNKENAEGKSGCCKNKENAEGKSGCCKNKENAEGKSGCCKEGNKNPAEMKVVSNKTAASETSTEPVAPPVEKK